MPPENSRSNVLILRAAGPEPRCFSGTIADCLFLGDWDRAVMEGGVGAVYIGVALVGVEYGRDRLCYLL